MRITRFNWKNRFTAHKTKQCLLIVHGIWYMHVFVNVCRGGHTYECEYISQKLASDVLLFDPPSYFSRHGLSLNLELPNWLDHLTTKSPRSLTLCWYHHSWLFMWVLGIQTQTLMLIQHVLSSWAISPDPQVTFNNLGETKGKELQKVNFN